MESPLIWSIYTWPMGIFLEGSGTYSSTSSGAKESVEIGFPAAACPSSGTTLMSSLRRCCLTYLDVSFPADLSHFMAFLVSQKPRDRLDEDSALSFST